MNYRVYCFDGIGKVWTAEWIQAPTDEEAIEAARAMDVGVKCEVWEGRRLVATVDAKRGIARSGNSVELPRLSPGDGSYHNRLGIIQGR
jgi:hypothetical protein